MILFSGLFSGLEFSHSFLQDMLDLSLVKYECNPCYHLMSTEIIKLQAKGIAALILLASKKILILRFNLRFLHIKTPATTAVISKLLFIYKNIISYNMDMAWTLLKI